MAPAESTPLYPPLFKRGKASDFVDSGRTIASCLSPRDLSAVVYATSAVDPLSLRSLKKHTPKAQNVYTASIERLPTPERRSFITDTSVVFSALQNIRLSNAEGQPSLTSDEKERAMVKLAMDYMALAKDAWAQSSNNTAEENSAAEHYRIIYTCLSLFVVLYLPESGLVYAPVGEELMDWLNYNFVAPTTEEGDHLSALEHPWEDDNFWPYLTRTVLRGLLKSSDFFLATLAQHPSEHLSSLSEDLRPLVTGRPRLFQFQAEREFVVAQRRWKERVKSLRLRLDRVAESARKDNIGDWWTPLSNIVGILEGRGDVIKDVCSELDGDWKEACAAWGMFVDHRLVRPDLPDVVQQILEEMPPDPTDLADNILASLFSGRPADAVVQASKHDLWLSAHWADLMESLELWAAKTEERDLSPRQECLLAYADSLRSDVALWRIAVAYMGACGDIGLRRMDEVLLRIPILPSGTAPSSHPEDIEGTVEAVPPILKEVVQTCFEYGREHVRRIVCSIAAQAFLRHKQYGLAISYLTSAENWTALGHVVDSMLSEYILHGPERFTRLVATVAPSLQELQAHPGAAGVFIHRLLFAVRYAEFHQRRLSGDLQDAALDLEALFERDIAPKAWWGVLLCDATELLNLSKDGVLLFSSHGAVQLLRRLQEINIGADHNSGDVYLVVLQQTMKGASPKDASDRLRRTGLALAKYYAACTVLADTV